MIDVEFRKKDDDFVLVQWKEPGWLWHDTWFRVGSANRFPADTVVKLRWRPATTEVYADGAGFRSPAYTSRLNLWLLALVAWLPVLWLARFARWWYASRRPGQPVTIVVWEAYPATATLLRAKTCWLEIGQASGRRHFQRVMWEPWLADLEPRRYRATARRAGRSGPMLVTVPIDRHATGGQTATAWWAGRARARRPQGFEAIAPGPPAPGGTRWSYVAIALVTGVLAALPGGPAAAGLATLAFVALVQWVVAGPMPTAPVPRFRRWTKTVPVRGPAVRRRPPPRSPAAVPESAAPTSDPVER